MAIFTRSTSLMALNDTGIIVKENNTYLLLIKAGMASILSSLLLGLLLNAKMALILIVSSFWYTSLELPLSDGTSPSFLTPLWQSFRHFLSQFTVEPGQ